MTLVPVATPRSGEEGLAEKLGYVPHPLRQALQSLGVEIDEADRVDEDELDLDAVADAYARFAGPPRDREEA